MKLNQITNEFLRELSTAQHQQPHISLYQPTHRHHPENKQDPILFRVLVKQLEHLLLQEKFTPEQVRQMLEPFEELGRDGELWNHTQEGLGVFASPGWFRVVGLPRTVQELTIVGESFHTKPLRRFLQSADRYQILGLSQHGIKLYEGCRNALEAIEPMAGVPRTIGEALGEELSEPHQTVASYGGVGGGSNAMRHGHGGKSDEMDIDADRFFRAIDRSVMESYSRPSGLPLILAALPEHHHRFHQISHNALLVPGGIKMHPDSISLDDLRERAWEIFEPIYRARLASLADDFAVAKSKGLGLDDLTKIGQVAATGRVAMLLIEADREIGGRIHPGSGNVHLEKEAHTSGDDLLDDLGDWVIKNGGQVVVVPTEQMPTGAGAAAICRY
jgi:hypothetical protein